MKKMTIKINQLKLENHPKLIELTNGDVFNQKQSRYINQISESQILILLSNIQLNVMNGVDGEYLLLAPNTIFCSLLSHPAARYMSVNLLIHEAYDDALIELFDTLNLVLPSLSFLEISNKSKTINIRHKQLKKMGHKPTTLKLLSQLANKNNSTFSKVG